jgi:type II secretory ATPase GspE/PulE/Tfp pilus assembly ATPase PilB-like protein
LHTNEAAGAITRLLDMGMEPFLLASSVILAQAQRLYRKLCPTCKKEIPLPVDLLKEHHLDPDIFKGARIYGAHGCPKCHSIGYRGRGAIMEVLPVDDDIRVGILRQAISSELRDIAESKGMVTLRRGILQKVKEGDTSIETAIATTVGDE